MQTISFPFLYLDDSHVCVFPHEKHASSNFSAVVKLQEAAGKNVKLLGLLLSCRIVTGISQELPESTRN